ncbi:MAG: bifunctional riboflavin kinase/FAD synthetase [Oscillospiraceae bacterium]|nr:bifunctional riboflavin kinase/FAD synthetase [Oscillospiraceae bacterium]
MKERTIYALGFFDGVHLGHQALLAACKNLARQENCAAGVITFDAHPDTLVLGKTPALINTAADRAILLKDFGIETVIALPFDKPMMEMSWQEFFRMLVETYHAAGIVCGSDFRFGHRGEGNAELLRAVCEKENIPCAVVPEQTADGIRVSSTHIRTLLEQGDMETAVRFLGHPHVLSGTVISGRKLGRTIDIPTANLALPEGLLIPRLGVYACLVDIDGKKHMAVTNVGTRPTVEGHHITVEPWILDFDGDLYGKQITLEFHKFLRPEQKFPNLSALQAEIRKNGEETRNFFRKM